MSVDCVIGGNRKQCNVAGALDSFGYLPLVCSTVAGDATRHNLAALGYEKAESTRFFVIDNQIFFSTKAANFSALKRASFSRAAGAACRTLAGAACWTLI